MSAPNTPEKALTLEQALKRLRKSCFRVRIEKEKDENGNEVWYFGSGFFVTTQGHALTAFHNLPKDVRQGNADSVDVFYGENQDTYTLEFRPELSDRKKDIAVLQLPHVDQLDFVPLTPAYIPLDVDAEERRVNWRRVGRLYVFGYPVQAIPEYDERKPAQPERLIQGKAAPLVSAPVPEYDEDARVDVNIERLHIDGDRASAPQGLSGGPVIDAATGWALAVEGSYYPDSGVVLATELAHMVEKWKGADDKTLSKSFRERKLAQWQFSVVGAARRRLSRSLWDRIREEMADVFPTADAVIVYDCLQGYTNDPETELVLGVEVQFPDSYDTHMIKLGALDRVANDYEGFQQCLQGQPFTSRTLVGVSRHDLAENRAAIIYENAWRFHQDDLGGEVCSLMSAVERSVKGNDPDPASIERVIRQVYDDQNRCFYFSGQVDSERALDFYKRRFGQDVWRCWCDEGWRKRLRGNLISLFCGRDAPDAALPAIYLDPCDYVRWAIETGHLPPSLVGPAHGDLNGHNVVVGIERGEVEHPVVFDYGQMGLANVLAWDFAKLETELKTRLLRDLYSDDEVREKLCPEPDAPEDWRKYLDPDRPSVLLEDDDFQVGRLAFGFWFDRKLAELTRQIAVAPATEEVESTGSAKLDRVLAILLRIRREAALALGSRKSWSGGAHLWMDDYYFALAAYGCLAAAADAHDRLLAGLALVSAGVAVAQMKSSQEKVQALASERGDPLRSPWPSYHVPMCHGYRLWKRGLQRTRDLALTQFQNAHNDFSHVVPFVREYALVLAASELYDEAQELVAPLRPLCRVFGDYETLCRIARIWRDKGNRLWDKKRVAVGQIREHATYEWYKTALDLYEEAFEFSEHYYPGVCTAQLAASLDSLSQAREVADSVLEICDRFTLGEVHPDDQFWIIDSRAIALLIKGDTEQAAQLYDNALKQLPREDAGPVQTSYDGICRLYWALGEKLVKPVAEVFWQSGFSLKAGPMGDCGRSSSNASSDDKS